MYVINPDPKLLSEWFCCGRRIAKYLLHKRIPLIHRNGKKFYFAKSEQLNQALREMPLLLKLLESL